MKVGRVLTILSNDNAPGRRLMLLRLELPEVVVTLLVKTNLTLSNDVLRKLSQGSLTSPNVLNVGTKTKLTIILSVCLFKRSKKDLLTGPFFLPMFTFTKTLTVTTLVCQFS